MNRLKLLSGAQLKYIAFMSMLIDHVNKALVYPNLNGGILLVISDIFDVLGRIAFAIFMFLLIEGYFRSTNRWKYLGMLLLFGLISEIPYDMFASVSYFEPNWNNIMFTLALVLAIVWSIDTLKEKMGIRWRKLWYFISVVIVGAGCLVSMNLGLDYEYHAVLIGYFLYIFHEKPVWAIPFCYLSIYKEPWALLGFGLSLTYNGERGRQNKIVNYLFYPVHLFILGMIRIYFGF